MYDLDLNRSCGPNNQTLHLSVQGLVKILKERGRKAGPEGGTPQFFLVSGRTGSLGPKDEEEATGSKCKMLAGISLALFISVVVVAAPDRIFTLHGLHQCL